MPTPHIAARPEDIAPAVLFPGDPRRAQRIAELLMPDARLVTDVRNMLGFTGTVEVPGSPGERRPLTVMGSGMGPASSALYATELYRFYDVQRIIRVGTCGGIAPQVKVGDVVVATGAHTDSSMNQLRIPGVNFSAVASFGLAMAAVLAAREVQAAVEGTVHAGTIITRDHFYFAPPGQLDLLQAYGVLGVEMETAAVYGVAAEHGREALTVLTVSDHLVDGSSDMTSEERESRFAGALRLAVAAALS